jgi:hypothetical protein
MSVFVPNPQGIARGRGEALIITSNCQAAVFRPTEIDGVE